MPSQFPHISPAQELLMRRLTRALTCSIFLLAALSFVVVASRATRLGPDHDRLRGSTINGVPVAVSSV